MDILATGKYAKHIALFAKLLHLDNLHVQYTENIFDDDLKAYYKKVCVIVRGETQFDMNDLSLQYVTIENYTCENEHLTIDCNDSIQNCEKRFIDAIQPIFDITDEVFLRTSISHIVHREVNNKEICFHKKNNEKKHINVFMWMCIMNTCNETRNMSYRDFFIKALRDIPKSKQRIAVLLSGYVRNHQLSSHSPIINSPYVDVFIHTWDDLGFKNDRRLIDNSWLSKNKVPLDVKSVTEKYNPVKILVENNDDLLNSFSLKDKISPIFLYSGQAKDDATRYINSQMYSIYKSYELMQQYEQEEGFTYDAIMRLRFDFQVSNFNWTGIIEDIDADGVYFPHSACNSHKHAGGGGGCISCDNNIQHESHTNDLCDIWFYGKRDDAAIACEMYTRGLKVLEDNAENNMKNLAAQRSYSEKAGYVYISSTHDIETSYVCFYPERILREVLKGISCKSSKNICGRI